MSDVWQSKLDFVSFLYRHRGWSTEAFGPGDRHKAGIDHIKKELEEIEEDPTDVFEWIDVMFLAMDGAWRAGHKPEQIAAAMVLKQKVNMERTWPDWREADPEKGIQHVE